MFILKYHMVAQMVKNPPAMQETCVQPLSQEDPLGMGGGVWWAAIYGVAQSRTRLKRLSSSSSSSFFFPQVFLQKILKHKIHPL